MDREERIRSAIRSYSESLSPEERAEFARTLLETTSAKQLPTHRAVPDALVWGSRLSSLVVAGYYWSLVSFDSVAGLRIAAGFLLPLAVVWFPNQLSRAAGHFSWAAPRITRASPPRAVL